MMEVAIIGWLYFWGGIVTFSLCAYANLNECGEMLPWGAAFAALTWPVLVPVIASRRLLRKFVAHVKSLEMH